MRVALRVGPSDVLDGAWQVDPPDPFGCAVDASNERLGWDLPQELLMRWVDDVNTCRGVVVVRYARLWDSSICPDGLRAAVQGHGPTALWIRPRLTLST